VPAVLTYRAINTLDSMIGHRSPHYLRFGWAAARLDDAANYLAARATAALVVMCAPVVSGSATGAARAWRRDAARHPSPNAGVVEAAFAGALGVRLGGPTQYHHGLQLRPTLGDGAQPTVADLRRAVVLSQVVQAAAALLAGLAVFAWRRCGPLCGPRRSQAISYRLATMRPALRAEEKPGNQLPPSAVAVGQLVLDSHRSRW
jgi:adenosylcobinamide-phosphate synthase